MVGSTSFHPSPRFQDSKIPRFLKRNLGNLVWNLGSYPFTSGSRSCYSDFITPVTRDRVWRPVIPAATKAAVLLRSTCGFSIFAPSYGGSMGGPQGPAGSRKRGPVRQPVESPPSFGDESGGFSKLPRLEAVMATSPRALAPASPITGTPDPIQLHAQAHNAMAMALHYLSQPQANIAAARRKAVQALSALRGLDLSLEG